MRAALLLLALAASVASLEIKFMVVETDPEAALRVAAAVEVGAHTAQARAVAVAGDAGDGDGDGEGDGEGGVEVRVEVLPVEFGETLDVPAQVCAAAQEDAHAVITGVGAGAALGAAAGARAGVPLLLVGPGGAAGAVSADWEALAMYPRDDLPLRAARDLAIEKGWSRAALLHAGSSWPAGVVAPDAEDLHLLVRQLPPLTEDAFLRDLLLVLKKAGYVNFLVWSDEATALVVLDAAQRVGLLSTAHSYIMLALELHTQDLEPFSHGGANITGLMYFDPEAELTRNLTAAWRAAYWRRVRAAGEGAGGEVGEGVDEVVGRSAYSARSMPGALLLAHDAALVAWRALAALQLPPPAAPGSCPSGAGAFHADTLLNYIRSEEHESPGATGALSWEADGWRRNMVLQVVELERGGQLETAGAWSEREGVTWRRRPRPAPPLPTDTMTNRTFRVLIAMNDPYVMEKESTKRLSGNDRYEGFCIELIEKLAEILHFNYTFVEQEDGKYGGYNTTTKQWEGMLRGIMDDEENLTLAITDLTITEEREKVVDFTTPFMNLGISILFHKPKTPEPELFAFLLPFSSGVWLCLGVAYVFSSLVLYCVGRLCPEEWQNPYPCIEEPDALENQFTLGNALWFNLGAVLLQGSEVAPVGYSTRAVASVWWLFALVITSSYTANLATLLAQKSSTEVIKNVEDLANNQLGIEYGAKETGSTYVFFQHSQGGIYKKMYEEMKKHKMPKDNAEGIRKVVEGGYAFLMESTTIEYVVERNCEVYMVGDLLDSKGYGIAMAKLSPYRQELNLALLRLQESGVLREMKRSWWEERNGGGACKDTEERESSKLQMNSFYGLFVVLVVGCFVGVVLACGDLAVRTRKHPRRPHRPFLDNFADELRFVFRFDLSAKPVTGPLIVEKTSSERTTEPDEVEAENEPDGHLETGGEGEGEGEGEDGAAGAGAGRCESAQSGPRRRRRSSMHTASMRLARHAHARDT